MSYTIGVHAVEQLLLVGSRRVHRLLLLPGRTEGPLARIYQLAQERGILVESTDRRELQTLVGRGNQGVVAETEPLRDWDLEELLAQAPSPELLVLLDRVEDPQNLGNILRSAAALGAGGVILPRRGAAGLTPAAIKVAAGAVERLPVARVTNLSRAMARLAERGIWICGLAEEAEGRLDQLDLSVPTALVLGGEGGGLRRLTRERCDHLVHLPTRPGFGTLNVAAAAAASLGEVARQRRIHQERG